MGTLQDKPAHHVFHLRLVCKKTFSLLGLPRVPKNKFNQRREKMQKERKTVKHNNDLAIKQSQGPLVRPQGL